MMKVIRRLAGFSFISWRKFIITISIAMKNYLLVLAIILVFISLASFAIKTPGDYEVPYPEGFRKWTHVKSALVGPQSTGFKFNGGFHHIYANDKAMQGYESGNFPQGSIFVFDVIEGLENNGNTSEGKRSRIDVMTKDSVKYKETGGWGYEEFKTDSKTDRVLNVEIRTKCFNCHSKQPDYIFSEWRN